MGLRASPGSLASHLEFHNQRFKQAEEDPALVYKGNGDEDDAGSGYDHLSTRIRLEPDKKEKAILDTLVWLGPPGGGKTSGALTFAVSWYTDNPLQFNVETGVIIIADDLLDALSWIAEFGLHFTYFWIIIDDALDKQDGRTAFDRSQISMLNIYEKLRHYFPKMRGTKFIINYTTQIDTLDPRIRNNAVATIATSNPGDHTRRMKLYGLFGHNRWLKKKLGEITRDFRDRKRGGAARGEFIYWTDVPEYGFLTLVKYHGASLMSDDPKIPDGPEIVDLRRREELPESGVLGEPEKPGEVSLFPLVERIGERIEWGQPGHSVRTEIGRIAADETETKEIRELASDALSGRLGAVKDHYKTFSEEHQNDTARIKALVPILRSLRPDTFYSVEDEVAPRLGLDLAMFGKSKQLSAFLKKYAVALGREIGLSVHKSAKMRYQNKYYLVISEHEDEDEARKCAIGALKEAGDPLEGEPTNATAPPDHAEEGMGMDTQPASPRCHH